MATGTALTARAHKATGKRIERALDGYRAHGSNRGAAKAAGVSEGTLRAWRRADPEFASAVHAAIDECLEADGQAAASYVREHIAALREGKRQPRQVVTAKGDVVEVMEPIKPESGLIQAALRKWNTGYRASLPAAPVAGDGGLLADTVSEIMRKLGPETLARIPAPLLEAEPEHAQEGH